MSLLFVPKPIFFLTFLTAIITILSITVPTQAVAQSWNPFNNSNQGSCTNGKTKHTNPLIPKFSFCYDSSVSVVDNIRQASEEDKVKYHEITNQNKDSRQLTGEITIKYNNDPTNTLVLSLKESDIKIAPVLSCTPNDITVKELDKGYVDTPRSSTILIDPVRASKMYNTYSQEYNGKTANSGETKDSEGKVISGNNITNPTDPTKDNPLKAPIIYNPSLNEYISTLDKTDYPFKLTIQGNLLPNKTEFDKQIISQLQTKTNPTELTLVDQVNVVTPTTANQEQEYNAGKGRCFDNSQTIYGMNMKNNSIVNPFNSDGKEFAGGNNPFSNIYNNSNSGNNSEKDKIKPTLNQLSDYKSVIDQSSVVDIFTPGTTKSLQLYSSTNDLTNLATVIESICWNELTCFQRDSIIQRQPNYSKTMVPKKVINSNNAKALLDPVFKKQEDQKANKAKADQVNPYHDQFVTLTYTVHCDGNSELTGSQIPAPIMKELQQEDQDQSKFKIKISSIYKKFPLKVNVYSDECNNLSVFGLFNIPLPTIKSTSYSQHDIPQGVDHINNFVYKDTINLKDEDIAKYWSEEAEYIEGTRFKKAYDKDIEISIRGVQLGFLIDPNLDQTKVTQSDEVYSRSRIYGEFYLNNLKTKEGKPVLNGKDILFKYEDITTKVLGQNILPVTSGKYLNESEKSNRVNIGGTFSTFQKDPYSVERNIEVKGDRSNQGGVTKNQTNDYTSSYEFIKNIRKTNLEFIDTNDRAKYAKQYDNQTKPKVWIVSHGWCDTATSFKPIGKEIKKANPNDIVFTMLVENVQCRIVLKELELQQPG
jgi:hypothetical protein